MRPNATSREQLLPFSSDLELRRRFMVVNEPVPANMRFGLLLEVLDKLAEESALAYARRSLAQARVVTAAIDDIVLRTPADVTRDLRLRARLNWVGKSSMEVGIRIEHPAPHPVHVASCYFTMVARQGEGDAARSVPVAPLEYLDDVERRRGRTAAERREKRRRHAAVAAEPPSREEYDLLARLHAAQEAPDFSGHLAGALTSAAWERVYPEQENVPSKVFGGHLVRRAYELAGIQAEAIAPDRPVIVRVNRINFVQPVRIGDRLQFVSRIVYAGRTSLCVEVTIERTSRDRVTKALSNTCVFTFVNVDERMQPRPVAPVYPTTYAEDARYLEAFRRHQRRRVQTARGLSIVASLQQSGAGD
ncbi:MAG: acyl-CoA thioesterase [Gemmatimonadetes bacterium]|nr:MAG: acyl-CoA thioesterase [Gemmatimonadota bacterium]PYO64864.1 MAG: acyl-CoA thioesterase [Gemmatimonadota bacterium]PYO85423.1 MAG: acyl-CoA thioesterase [Gemmatimonadota bacterium]PYP64368.1 MAG: acyl-CoA thioesterase [Gemmatimonadota bacterium]